MRRRVARLRGDRRAWSVAAVCVATSVVLSGCSDPGPAPLNPLERPPGHVYLYGSDGNMLNGIGELIQTEHPDAIVGMKGTTPLTEVSQSFRNRLRSIDSSLVDVLYAGETYDAVVISALAAQLAGSTDPRAIASQINAVTVGGEECETPAHCLSLIGAGEDISYRGITLGLGGFTDAGEPSASTYGILRFGAGNQLADSLTQFVPAGNAGAASAASPPAGGGPGTVSPEPLRIGALLPQSGALATAGPPMFAGLRLAIQEINDAGGVLGHDVQFLDGDDGTNGEVAKATATRLIGEGAQVLIGAGASGVTLAVLPVTVQAGVILFSPSNTAAVLTDFDDDGLYFRTAPPDGLQAAALADIIVRDGTRKLSIIYRDDAYGAGLAESTKANLVGAGLAADDIALLPYSAEAANALVGGDAAALDFTGAAEQVRQADPDGVLIIAFDETANIVDALLAAEITSITN